MPTFNFTSGNTANLTGGGPASMADIQGPFTDIRSGLNGNLDEVNVPNLAAAFTTYKQLHRFTAVASSGAPSAGNYVMFPAAQGSANTQFNTGFAAPSVIVVDFDPTDFNANARTTKLRIRAVAYTNAVAPAITLTPGLYPVATFGGTSGNEPFVATLSPVVTGAQASIVSPSASARTVATSADFNFPAAGAYVMSLSISGIPAANSVVDIVATLEFRQV